MAGGTGEAEHIEVKGGIVSGAVEGLINGRQLGVDSTRRLSAGLYVDVGTHPRYEDTILCGSSAGRT